MDNDGLDNERVTWAVHEIAAHIGARVVGDDQLEVAGMGTLQNAMPGQLSFLAQPKYVKFLASTAASAVILHEQYCDQFKGVALVLDNPYLGYAKASHLFRQRRAMRSALIHPSALVSADAQLSGKVYVGPNVVIEAGARIGEGVDIGANVFIGRNTCIGANTTVNPNVVIYDGVSIGERVIIHSAAVIGADGFGFAPDQGRWQKIAQLGGVRIGNDVEIGAGTTIDRGAIDDTVLENGVILDNQVQIAHNVVIGKNTAIAGCSAIAGSSVVGECCTIAGGVGVVGHVTIVDHVHITAMTLVTKSISRPGSYSSGSGLSESGQWRKNVARFKQLDRMAKRLKVLEQAILDE